VAVVGSGPASLTVAYDLAGDGFNVVVYEAQQEPGGVLLYGIPNFRLPKDVVRRQIKRIEEAGVTFITNCIVGTDITVDNMFESGFDAVFIGTGTAVEKSLDLKNSDAVGIFKAQYFLRMVTLCNDNKLDMSELPVRKNNKVIVIGAGNVAMDAAITARRLGARVELVYRRTKDDMPCLNSEYEEAIEEGVIFNFSTSPVEYMVDDNKLCGLRVQCVDGERTIKADNVIVAIGSKPANRIISTTKGISVDDQGYIVTRTKPYGMTTLKGVFAGGDVVHKPATVVLAMREAKKAVVGIIEYVEAKKLMEAMDS
jgi:glutamate synthase (NADPH/NADH) small chain